MGELEELEVFVRLKKNKILFLKVVVFIWKSYKRKVIWRLLCWNFLIIMGNSCFGGDVILMLLMVGKLF